MEDWEKEFGVMAAFVRKFTERFVCSNLKFLWQPGCPIFVCTERWGAEKSRKQAIARCRISPWWKSEVEAQWGISGGIPGCLENCKSEYFLVLRACIQCTKFSFGNFGWNGILQAVIGVVTARYIQSLVMVFPRGLRECRILFAKYGKSIEQCWPNL